MTGIRDEYQRLRAILIAAYLCIVALAAAISASYLWSEYRQVRQTAAAQTATLTRALEEHVLRTFAMIDLQLRNSGRKLVETRALEQPSTPQVVEGLREDAASLGFLRSIYVYDAAGRGHTTALGADIGHLRARDFEYLREILDGPSDRPVIGRLIDGAVTGRPNIPVARAILNKDGRLAGIIGTAIEPAYFEKFYTALNLEAGGSLALVRGDGAVLVRYPKLSGERMDLSGSEIFRERIAGVPNGTVDIQAALDGAARVVSFRHVSGWNLIVTNTLTHEAVLAPWWRVARAVGLLVIVSLGMSLALLKHLLQAMDRRAEAEERYALAVRGSNDGIWDWNVLTHEEYLSPRWKEIVGYQDQDLPNTRATFLELIHPEDRERVTEAASRHIERGEPYEVELRLLHKDGSYRWIRSRGESLRDAAGHALRMAGSITDITERKQAEEAMRELNASLEQRVQERTAALQAANEELIRSMDQLRLTQAQLVQSAKMAALGELVAGVTHEINTPVGIGVTAASHLQMKVGELAERFNAGTLTRGEMGKFVTTAGESADMVLSNLLRASDLIRSFKQVAVDQSSGKLRNFRLKEYLDEVLVSLSPQLKKTAHKVSLDCPEGIELDSYPGAYSQIITNLVLNSLDHGFENKDRGHIDIAVRREPGGLRLTYRDDGKGIAAEHLEKIFDPFFTTRRGAGGSGLGMHIVYNLVTRTLGGTIECSSSPGQGVCIEIRLPLHSAVATSREEA